MRRGSSIVLCILLLVSCSSTKSFNEEVTVPNVSSETTSIIDKEVYQNQEEILPPEAIHIAGSDHEASEIPDTPDKETSNLPTQNIESQNVTEPEIENGTDEAIIPIGDTIADERAVPHSVKAEPLQDVIVIASGMTPETDEKIALATADDENDTLAIPDEESPISQSEVASERKVESMPIQNGGYVAAAPTPQPEMEVVQPISSSESIKEEASNISEFSNKYLRFSIPPELEIQEDSYKDFVAEVIPNTERKDRIVLQQKGLNSFNPTTLDQYCRIIITTIDTDAPVSNPDFATEVAQYSKADVDEIANIFKQALERQEKIIRWYDANIRKIGKLTSFHMSYERQGRNGAGPVTVDTYIIPDGSLEHSIQLAYRTSERLLWKNALQSFVDSLSFTSATTTKAKPNNEASTSKPVIKQEPPISVSSTQTPIKSPPSGNTTNDIMNRLYGENWGATLAINFFLTWLVSLAPAIIARTITGHSWSYGKALIFCVVNFIALVLFWALVGSKGTTSVIAISIAYIILVSGKKKEKTSSSDSSPIPQITDGKSGGWEVIDTQPLEKESSTENMEAGHYSDKC